jgi:hypothetical protein
MKETLEILALINKLLDCNISNEFSEELEKEYNRLMEEI